MLKGLLKAHSTFRFSYQELSHEILDSFWEMFGKFQIDIQNFTVCLLPTFWWLKGSMTGAKFITKYSHTPHIDHFIIFASHDNLRRNIIKCAAESCPFISEFKKIYTFCRYRSTIQNQPVSPCYSLKRCFLASSRGGWFRNHVGRWVLG